MAYKVIKGAMAESGDRADIPQNQSDIANQISYSEGFPGITSDSKILGGLPPRRSDINEVFYLTTANLYELQNGKYPTFNADVLPYLTNNGYPLNAILWSEVEQRFLRSSIADNASNFITNPETIGTNWLFLNDEEISNVNTGLTLSFTTSLITIAIGQAKSNNGRILILTTALTNSWADIQTNSTLTPSANSTYSIWLAYNITAKTYLILASLRDNVPTLPTGYTDYVEVGYISTTDNIDINNVYPSKDLNSWFISGEPDKDKLPRFCANSGNLDANGNADLLSVSGSVITFKVDDGASYKPLVCTPANELIPFTLTTLNNFNSSLLSDGNYTICVSKNGVISSLGALSISDKEPTSPAVGNIWLKTSIEPLTAYKYTGSWVPFYEVPIAKITVVSGSITASKTLPYNSTGLTKKISSDGSNLATTTGATGVRAIVESYVNGASWYRIWSDGWIEQGGKTVGEVATIVFLKAFSNTDYGLLSFPIGLVGSSDALVGTISLTTTGASYQWVGANSRPTGIMWSAHGF